MERKMTQQSKSTATTDLESPGELAQIYLIDSGDTATVTVTAAAGAQGVMEEERERVEEEKKGKKGI